MTFQTNEKRMSNLRKIRESDEDVALYRWILTERRGERTEQMTKIIMELRPLKCCRLY